MTRVVIHYAVIISLALPLFYMNCAGGGGGSPDPTPTPQGRSISGTVYDSLYHPRAGVLVLVGNLATQSDTQGHYRLYSVPEGRLMVTAYLNEYGFKDLVSKVVDADRCDFRMSFGSIYEPAYGMIAGSLSGYSSDYPAISGIDICSLSEKNWSDGILLINGETQYLLDYSAVGTNRVLAIESIHYSLIKGFGSVNNVQVTENATTKADIVLDAASLENLNGTFPTSYHGYGGVYLRIRLWFPSVTYWDVLVEAGSQGLSQFQDGEFSFATVPVLWDAIRQVAVFVVGSSAQEDQIFMVSQRYSAASGITFTQEPDFLEIIHPSTGQENLGETPLLAWSTGRPITRIWLLGSTDGAEFFNWHIETPGNELQLPALSFISLAAYDKISATFDSPDYLVSGFPTIDPSQGQVFDYTNALSETYFYAGSSSSKTTSKFDRASIATMKARFGESLARRGIVWKPLIEDQWRRTDVSVDPPDVIPRAKRCSN